MKPNQVDRESFLETGELTTRLIMDAVMFAADVEHGRNIWENGERVGREEFAWHEDLLLKRVHGEAESINKVIKQFDKTVWLGGLGKDYMSRDARGCSAELADGSLLLYCLAGRVMLTFRSTEGEISLLTDDCVDESRMGLQSIYATHHTAINLIGDAMDLWSRGLLTLTDDTSVGLG